MPVLDPLDVVCKLMDRITANDLLKKVREKQKEKGKGILQK